jgi:hypothetical protein
VHRDFVTDGAQVVVDTPAGRVAGVVSVQPLRAL